MDLEDMGRGIWFGEGLGCGTDPSEIRAGSRVRVTGAVSVASREMISSGRFGRRMYDFRQLPGAELSERTSVGKPQPRIKRKGDLT